METKNLKEILNKAYKHINTRDIEEFWQSFVFDNDRILALNKNYAVEYPFESGIQAIVPAEETLKIINGIESEKIMLNKKGNSFFIKSSGIKAEISCYKGDDIPLDSYFPEKYKWAAAPDNFNEGIKLCMFSASKDISMEIFNAVKIYKDSIYSTDNFRISIYQMSGEMKEFLLPLTSAVVISNHTTIRYQLEDNIIHFKNKDKSIFHCRLIDGSEFPDVDSFFQLKKKSSFKLPAELSKTISLVSVLAEGDFLLNKKIKVSIENGVMKCRAENETGWIESNIKIKTDKNISFMINPFFFIEILKLSSKAHTDGKKIIFTVGNDFSHLMMLLEEKE